jgi:hypothetical protein
VTDDTGASTNSASIKIGRYTKIHVPSDYSTIQAGIDAAVNGDTVLVADGIYKGEGNKNLDFNGKAITVMSESGPENTIIDCEGNGRGFIFQSGEGQDSVVSGFMITNGKAMEGGGIRIHDSSPTISKCIIKNCQTYYPGDYYGGGIYCSAWSAPDTIYPIIENSIIANNKSGRYGGGIYFHGANATIINCTIVNNSTDNSFDASGGGIYSSYSSPIITNSILWSNYPNALGANIGSSVNVKYSNVEGGQQGEGNIDLNPQLVGPLNGNYRLKDHSPCIGTGTSEGAPVLDIVGESRPNPPGSNPDMGAYENSLAVPVTRPLDVFGIETANHWKYQGTYMGTTPYTWESEVVTHDQKTFPTTTYIIEYKQDGILAYKFWYETTANKLKRWGEESNGNMIKYSKGLVEAWYPMKVNDQKESSATINLNGYEFNISLTVDVLSKETVALGFDTFEAYKVRNKIRIWGYGEEVKSKYYQWVVPYLGIIQYQDSAFLELLTAFAINGGTITQDTDADSDGLKDYQELIVYNTNWQDPDTDDDGLTDGEEVNTHESDPNDNDSDDDGLNDGDEVNIYGTDPTNEDTDDDGLTDFEEINTHNTDPNNEDTDGDELSDGDEIAIGTDPFNPDTDEDGMPDGWEYDHDLNPFVNDAGDDPDGDGLTNLEEYNLGRHPTNVEPDKPILLLPDDTATDVLLTPELQTQSFTDTDGDFHAQSQWQIGRQIGNPEPCSEESFTNSDYIVFDATSDTQLTLFNVPDLLLDIDTDYCWRARFTDTGRATSEWADPFSFSTIAQSEDDQNPQNGIPDDQEADCLGIFNPGEIPPDTVCVDALVSNAQVGIEGSTNVVSMQAFRSVDPGTIPESLPKVELLIGLMSFKAEVDQVGDIIEIIFHSSEPMPAEAKCYKYDPINGWQDYSAHIVAISPDRKSITLEYKDGDFGDLDGVANKFVIDPIGFGVAAEEKDDGGGGGGGGGG